jgi:hypothetical protein
VYQRVTVILASPRRQLTMNRRRLFLQSFCKLRSFVAPTHRFPRSVALYIEVSARRRNVRVPQHIADVMQRPTRLEQPRAGFVPKIVKVQIDRDELCA